MGAVSLRGDSVNHCAPIAVSFSLRFGLGFCGVIGADAIRSKTANGGERYGVIKAESFVGGFHVLTPIFIH